jgi:hypothetical protein
MKENKRNQFRRKIEENSINLNGISCFRSSVDGGDENKRKVEGDEAYGKRFSPKRWLERHKNRKMTQY